MNPHTSQWTAVRLDRVRTNINDIIIQICILHSFIDRTLFFFSDSIGDVSIGIKCAPGVVGPAEADIDFDIIKNDNDTFTVKYTPPGPGRYTIMVVFADQVKQ